MHLQRVLNFITLLNISIKLLEKILGQNSNILQNKLTVILFIPVQIEICCVAIQRLIYSKLQTEIE